MPEGTSIEASVLKFYKSRGIWLQCKPVSILQTTGTCTIEDIHTGDGKMLQTT